MGTEKNNFLESIILAGGLGTRLRTVVADRPKALSEVAGRPFLDYVIAYLKKSQVNHYIFSLGFLATQVIEHVEKSYADIQSAFSLEDTPLGTGGAIKRALEMAKQEHVLIINADTYFNIDLQKMYQQHLDTNADCTFALKPMSNFDRYGTVEMNSDKRITLFKEKIFTEQGLINGGYIFLKKNCLKQQNLPEIFSFEKDFVEPNLADLKIYGFVSNGYFIDIGVPADYEKAQVEFNHINL